MILLLQLLISLCSAFQCCRRYCELKVRLPEVAFKQECPFVFSAHYNVECYPFGFIPAIEKFLKWPSKIKFEPQRLASLLEQKINGYYYKRTPETDPIPTENGIDYLMYHCHRMSLASTSWSLSCNPIDRTRFYKNGSRDYYLVIPVAEQIVSTQEWCHNQNNTKKIDFRFHDPEFIQKLTKMTTRIMHGKERTAKEKEQRRQKEIEAIEAAWISQPLIPEVNILTSHAKSPQRRVESSESSGLEIEEENFGEQADCNIQTKAIETRRDEFNQPGAAKVSPRDLAAKLKGAILSLNIRGRALEIYHALYSWCINNPTSILIILACIALLLTLINMCHK